jgi:serine O-acetyltransferase
VSPVIFYRCARYLGAVHIPVLPRLIDLFIRTVFSCVLPHTARIGSNFSLGYGGLGCVIHKDATIGNDVEIGANVLIGGNARVFGVPIVEDGVYIGFGAVIIGPITVGHGAVIGANSVVTTNVPPCAVVAGVPARVLRQCRDGEEILYHRRRRELL